MTTVLLGLGLYLTSAGALLVLLSRFLRHATDMRDIGDDLAHNRKAQP